MYERVKKWLRGNVNYADKKSLAYRFRMRRMKFFEEFYKDRVLGDPEIRGRAVRILDVGGTSSFWKTLGFSHSDTAEITLLNLKGEEVRDDGRNMTGVAGDATDLGGYSDGEFDLVFSNSVIEHVGNYGAQERMAREACRVGRHLFLQTPNKFFFMEPHFLFPFFQWLPLGLRARLIERGLAAGGEGRGGKAGCLSAASSVRLLTRRELRALFPKAKIRRERFCMMTKSFYLYF